MSITLSLFVFLCRIIRVRAAEDKKKSGYNFRSFPRKLESSD